MPSAPVDILCPDLSDNALGRALVLAELVQPFAPVRVIGWQSGTAVWAPARDTPFELCRLTGPNARMTRSQLAAQLRATVRGHRLIVSKARWTSLALADAAGLHASSFWLDLDDYELSFVLARAGRKPSLWGSPRYLTDLARAWWCERVASARTYPNLTVANAWLRHRYGGEVLYHLRDASALTPDNIDVERVREQMGLQGRLWVGFVGTLRAHKGVPDLVRAVAGISAQEVDSQLAPGVLLAGVDATDAVARALVAEARDILGEDRLRVQPLFPADRLAQVLAAPDIVAIPTREASSSYGQTPAKLFDALFMAKATLASAVGDMPVILDGVGEVFQPGNVPELRRKLQRLLASAPLRAELGAKARAKALSCYTFDGAFQTAAERLRSLPLL